ncbi:glycoside hydrolase 15 protein, partial [Phlyctochytrium bullatum]
LVGGGNPPPPPPPPPPPTNGTVVVTPNVPAANGPNVVVQQYSCGGSKLSGGIWVKNLAFNKAVTVTASTPTGVWGNSISASYSSTAANGYELWTFSGPIAGLGSGSLFYVKYDVNGVSYYDSNGGPTNNYRVACTAPPPPPLGLQSDVSDFFTAGIPSIKQFLLANISPAGALKGMIVAAPANQPTTPQNYFFHWIRDAALVMDSLYQLNDNTLDQLFFDYQALTKRIQGAKTLSGLGEAKFNVDGTGYAGGWCRPQNDGPGLRASGFIRFLNRYLARTNDIATVVSWYNSTGAGVIKPDLDYVVLNSADTNGCDLWEETRGLHLFSQGADRRALYEGAAFASKLGDAASASRYLAAARALDTSMDKYWSPAQQTLYTTLNARQLDAAIALSAIHNYNGDGVYGPADDRVLNSLYQFALGMINEYTLNSAKTTDASGRPLAPAIGRYYGDTYNGVNSGNQGNPWYLTTLSLGETYHKAAKTYLDAGSITVTALNLPFFTGDRPAGLQLGVTVGTYAKGTKTFSDIVKALASLGDEYIRRTAFHGAPGYHFHEQFLRSDGSAGGLSVHDLTWSYAALLTSNIARQSLAAGLATL